MGIVRVACWAAWMAALPPATSTSTWRCTSSAARGGSCSFWGRFFSRAVLILTFVHSMRPMTLLGYDASGCLRHLEVRQEELFLLGHGYRRPGFWDKAAYGQWRLIHQRDNVRHRTGRDGLVRLATDAQQPQGGHGDGQPQARGPLGLGHVRPMPLPAGPFRDLEALLNPGPQASRVQWSCRWRPLKAMPVPCQEVPGSGTKVCSGTPRTWPLGRKVPPVLMRKNGCHPRRVMRRNSQRAYKPRSASTMTVHDAGTARRT